MAGINLGLGQNTSSGTSAGGGLSGLLDPITTVVQPVVTAGNGGITVGVNTPVTGDVTATLGTSGATDATGASSSGAGQGAIITTVTLGSGSGAIGGVDVGLTTPVAGATVTVGGAGAGVGVTTPILGGTGGVGGSGTGDTGGVGVGVTTPGGGGTVTVGGSGSGAGSDGGGAGGVGVVITTPVGGGTVTVGTGGGGGAPSTSVPDAQTAYVNIFRLGSTAEIPTDARAQLDQLQQQVNTGAITATQAVLKVGDMAIGATSVAVTSYQFFSGLTPSADGLSYLVHSPANPTDLSDSYYTVFNTENRYINFASNLGLHSDYAAGFAQTYGSMTFQQAVATAYDRIVGDAEATQAGINPQAAVADIVSRQSYFQAVAHERFGNDNQDLSTKLAAIAYIMEESVKADVGRYGHAEQNFLFDLADGKAQFHVDLVGTYGGFAQPTNTTF